jgi:hypothetical protein
MTKHFLLLAALILSMQVIAQTGIGTSTPDPSAKLHVASDRLGFLPPQVTLTSTTDNTTIRNVAGTAITPAVGLLVYNFGSVGLQAGYYYWNGANWATIATGTNAGNAVIAGDLVKLYQETYSTTAGKASSSTGYSFTVPVSGRYEFNFNCTGWNSNGSLVKLTFNIREGTNVIGTDYHQSASSNAWVEYEGRFEVNLTAGVTYNAQVVTTTGRRDNGYDWDKIMYKMVAGNLPVNQHMAAQNVQLNNNFLSNDGGNEGIRIDNAGNVGIGTNTPSVPLDINGAVNASTLSLSNTTNGTSSLILRNGDAATTYADNPQIRMGWAGSTTGTSQYAQFLHTRHNSGPTNNAIDFYLSNGTANNTITSGSTRAMSITSPGNVEITGKLNIGDPTGNVATKASGMVAAGTFVELDNLKCTVTTAAQGNRGLSIGAVSTTFEADVSGYYTRPDAIGGVTGNNQTYTTTASASLFNWNFPAHGDMVQVNLRDKTNNRFYRITMMIGSGYVSNFISIERLF